MTIQPQKLGDLEPFPLSIKPMLATLASEPFSDPKRLFEPKLDGFRIMAFIRKGEVTLLTRNGNDYTPHYPWVAQDLAAYADSEMVVDGEMAALNDKGVPDFNLMQHSAEIAKRGLRLEGEYPIVYYPTSSSWGCRSGCQCHFARLWSAWSAGTEPKVGHYPTPRFLASDQDTWYDARPSDQHLRRTTN